MKKWIVWTLVLALVLGLTACGAQATETEASAPAVQPSEEASPTLAQNPPEEAPAPAEAASAAEETAQEPLEEHDLEEVYSMAQRALDQQAIQNLMSWHVMYHCYGLHREEMEQIWVQEPENQATASFGQNEGFFVGYNAIWKAYVEGHDTSWLASAKQYCENNGIDISGMTDEEILEKYGGVGQLLLHVTTTAIIEVAEDGQTAKCFWYSPGMIAESGQNANTIWEAYGVDFVKENGKWKMWHLHMFTDFMGSFYLSIGGGSMGMGGPPPGPPPGEGGSGGWEPEGGEQVAIENADVNEYLTDSQYTIFSKDRLREDMVIFLPKAYESWSFDDDSYGPTREQFESYGIDLDAWDQAHS